MTAAAQDSPFMSERALGRLLRLTALVVCAASRAALSTREFAAFNLSVERIAAQPLPA
ncbi:MAG: hypothetical protein ABSC94_25595 [Polyangiaceae bacterium]|jgi:hypothetical protein